MSRPKGLRSLPGLTAGLLLALWSNTPSHGDQVAILDTEIEAIAARLHILESADRTIDVMYFAIHDDEVTWFALGLLREKALEGLRVRVITNPNGFKVESGVLHHLQGLDSLEIRVFDNPTMGRFKFLRQLHDKLLLVDSDQYITGGRNLGAAYFNLSEKYNKKDRDIYVIGASAVAAQNYFDDLWNSTEVSVGSYKDYPTKNRDEALTAAIARMEARVAEARQVEGYQEAVENTALEMHSIDDRFVRFVHDDVEDEKVQTRDALVQLTLDADEQVLIQSPYVVPDKGLFRLLEFKQQQGVPMTFVTNSVKSTVNAIATAATERYKRRMLDHGAEFYESTGDQMLHAKSMVFRASSADDGPPCWGSIGSYNIDPRSARLNTEMVVVVRDCAFADKLEELIMGHAKDSVRIASRADLPDSKALKKEIPFGKRATLALLKFLTPLYRSQI